MEDKGLNFEYVDITENMMNLKKFLKFRDEKIKKTKRKRRIYYLSNNPDSNLFEVSLEDELKLND